MTRTTKNGVVVRVSKFLLISPGQHTTAFHIVIIVMSLKNDDAFGKPPSRAWYSALTSDFLLASPDAIVGQLSRNSNFAIEQTQMEAWLTQIEVLKATLSDGDVSACLPGAIFFEFVIPRMGRRIDVVVVTGPIVFAIEFKTGSLQFENSGVEQVWDYALDLKNFHATSHHAAIIPIFVSHGWHCCSASQADC